jgi:hypothetical protein
VGTGFPNRSCFINKLERDDDSSHIRRALDFGACAFAPGVQHVKYWIDTEFIARPYTIDLISIGLVAEDGREFYAESSEVDWSKASLWTLENVRPQLDGTGMGRVEIGYAVRKFTDCVPPLLDFSRRRSKIFVVRFVTRRSRMIPPGQRAAITVASSVRSAT